MGQVYWQGELQSIHTSVVGDLVGWLERLCQKGYPVRPGLVLAATIFEQAILQHLPFATITPDVNRIGNQYQHLQVIAQTLQSPIPTTQLPPATISAISSALARMPHQHWQLKPSLIRRDSLAYLPDTSGWWDSLLVGSDVDAVAEAIRQLWHRTFSAQNLLYWISHHCQLEHINFAVLVQSIGSVTCSGFMRINAQACQIEWVWGMSQAITCGEAVPARLEIAWDGTVLAQSSGHQTLAYSSDSVIAPFDPHAQRLESDIAWNPPLFSLSDSPRQSLLSERFISALQAIAQQLWQDFHIPAVIEWSYGADADEPAQIWLVGFEALAPSPNVSEPVDLAVTPSPSSSTAPILRGLPASPGTVSGSAFILNPEWSEIPAPSGILVTSALGSLGLSLLGQVNGVITEQGGLTSHGAILARELGIPAVVGVPGATQRIQPGDWLTLDGDRGEIHYHLELETVSSPHLELLEPAEHPQATSSHSTWPPISTQLYVNLSQLESLDAALQPHLDGVGLLRSEFMMLSILEQQHPLVWIEQGRGQELSDRLADQIGKITQAFAPRPVFYRFLDLHGQGFPQLTESVESMGHPLLGLRGALSYQRFPALFGVELEALRQVQVAGSHNLNVLVPYVRSVSEFEFCRSQIQRAGLLSSADLQIWMMVEVPSILFQLADYQQAGVHGISIGSNDLTQLLLGVDRDHPLGGDLDERHPAVQRAIATLIQNAKELGLPCCICGDAPVLYPELVDGLVSWGITAISVNANAIEATYQAIVQAEEKRQP